MHIYPLWLTVQLLKPKTDTTGKKGERRGKKKKRQEHDLFEPGSCDARSPGWPERILWKAQRVRSTPYSLGLVRSGIRFMKTSWYSLGRLLGFGYLLLWGWYPGTLWDMYPLRDPDENGLASATIVTIWRPMLYGDVFVTVPPFG